MSCHELVHGGSFVEKVIVVMEQEFQPQMF
jgi:hypothetical protein